MASPAEPESKTWKNASGRKAGPDGYQFGDATRSIVNMLAVHLADGCLRAEDKSTPLNPLDVSADRSRFVADCIGNSQLQQECEHQQREPNAFDIMVNGAGGVGAGVNGQYTKVGELNGKPKYQHVYGESIIYFHAIDGRWKINDEDYASEWYYSAPTGDIASPCSGTWTTEGYVHKNAEPPPTISYVPQKTLNSTESRPRGGIGATVHGGHVYFKICGDPTDKVVFELNIDGVWKPFGSGSATYAAGKWTSSWWIPGQPGIKVRVKVNGQHVGMTHEHVALSLGEPTVIGATKQQGCVHFKICGDPADKVVFELNVDGVWKQFGSGSPTYAAGKWTSSWWIPGQPDIKVRVKVNGHQVAMSHENLALSVGDPTAMC